MLLTFSQTLQSVQGITWKKQGTGQGFYGLLYHKIPKIYCKAADKETNNLLKVCLCSPAWEAFCGLQGNTCKKRWTNGDMNWFCLSLGKNYVLQVPGELRLNSINYVVIISGYVQVIICLMLTTTIYFKIMLLGMAPQTNV